jgi:catechol 2,3-dioxygenase-like lactoylglutathione lyase family enzyme
MSVELHHVTVPATDKWASAEFLARILGVPVRSPDGPCVVVGVTNRVSLDFVDGSGFSPQHCTFLLTEDEFDAAYARLLDTRTRTWADPERTRPGQIDHRNGGRGLCFTDPDGHVMQILTRPDNAR